MVEHQNQVLKMSLLLEKFCKEKLKFLIKRQRLEVPPHHLQDLLNLDLHPLEKGVLVHLFTTAEIALHQEEEILGQHPNSGIVDLLQTIVCAVDLIPVIAVLQFVIEVVAMKEIIGIIEWKEKESAAGITGIEILMTIETIGIIGTVIEEIWTADVCPLLIDASQWIAVVDHLKIDEGIMKTRDVELLIKIWIDAITTLDVQVLEIDLNHLPPKKLK
jgi:hypothetical protein